MFHLYHNRHFGKSRQYQDFLEVLEDTELRTRDYAKIIITDCEKVKSTPVLTQRASLTCARTSLPTTKTERSTA